MSEGRIEEPKQVPLERVFADDLEKFALGEWDLARFPTYEVEASLVHERGFSEGDLAAWAETLGLAVTLDRARGVYVFQHAPPPVV